MLTPKSRKTLVRVPKDYATKVWKTTVDNSIAVEKKALTEQTQDSFFGILAIIFPHSSNKNDSFPNLIYTRFANLSFPIFQLPGAQEYNEVHTQYQ